MRAGNEVKVAFALDASDWHQTAVETLWARVISDAIGLIECELLNTPFFAKGVSYQDIVVAQRSSAGLEFLRHKESRGHSTYRILRRTDDARFELRLAELLAKGCSYESTTMLEMKMYALDILPHASLWEIYRLLERGEEDDIWLFDEGHVGHPVDPEAPASS